MNEESERNKANEATLRMRETQTADTRVRYVAPFDHTELVVNNGASAKMSVFTVPLLPIELQAGGQKGSTRSNEQILLL